MIFYLINSIEISTSTNPRMNLRIISRVSGSKYALPSLSLP